MDESRSCNSNSTLSTQYYQPNKLEKDLWFRVATRDYTELLKAFDFGKLFAGLPTPIELLDVGCGTGKFPSMLSKHISTTIQVYYDYLDPSQYSLEELAKSLSPPFTPRTAWQTTLEGLERMVCPSQGYHLIWSLQSLYCIQRHALRETIEKLHSLLHSNNGIALIYLAASDAFYHRLYQRYIHEFHPHTRQPYITAEEVTTALDGVGLQHDIKKLHFSHTIACSEQEVLKNYINQCVFDAEAWENSQKNNMLKTFLASFNNREEYRFPQQVWLIMFRKGDKK